MGSFWSRRNSRERREHSESEHQRKPVCLELRNGKSGEQEAKQGSPSCNSRKGDIIRSAFRGFLAVLEENRLRRERLGARALHRLYPHKDRT